MMKIDPVIISRRAGVSYLQMKTSLRNNSAIPSCIKIAVDELIDSSTISANGVAAVNI